MADGSKADVYALSKPVRFIQYGWDRIDFFISHSWDDAFLWDKKCAALNLFMKQFRSKNFGRYVRLLLTPRPLTSTSHPTYSLTPFHPNPFYTYLIHQLPYMQESQLLVRQSVYGSTRYFHGCRRVTYQYR